MKVQNMLPEVYYRESRDFAFIGRLIEILFNYMKTGADCVKAPLDSDATNSNTVQLLVNSLGFESKREYINKDLIYIASTFYTLLKNKGTGYAIDMAIRLLLNSQHIRDYSEDQFVEQNGYLLTIKIPNQLQDLVLIEDLFEYILPAGMLYKFVKIGSRNNVAKTSIVVNSSNDNISYSNTAKASYIAGSEDIYDQHTLDPKDKLAGLGTIYTGNILNNEVIRTPQKQKNTRARKSTSSAKLISGKQGDLNNENK